MGGQHSKGRRKFKPGLLCTLSEKDSTVEKTEDVGMSEAVVLGTDDSGSKCGSDTRWTVAINSTKNCLLCVGVVPKSLIPAQTDNYQQGWFLNARNCRLYSRSNCATMYEEGHITTGSLVTVILHEEGDHSSLSFNVDDHDLGVAFKDLPPSKELTVCVLLTSKGDSVSLL